MSAADAAVTPAGQEGEEAPQEAEVTMTTEELKALVGHLYAEVPHFKAVFKGDVKRCVPGDMLVGYLMDEKSVEFGMEGITTEEEAVAVVNALLAHSEPHFLIRAGKLKDRATGKTVKQGKRKVLGALPPQMQVFGGVEDTEARYVWLFSGEPSFWSRYLPAFIVLGVLAVTLFPLWPMWLKRIVFYLSLAFLVAFSGLLAVRYTVGLLGWIAGFEAWIFPRFWDEVDTISGSFIPFWQFEADASAGDYLWFRLAAAAVLTGVGAWAVSAPDQVGSLLQSQRAFAEDLYSGALMEAAPEVSMPGNDRFGNKGRGGWGGSAPRVRAFDDIWKELDEEEEAAAPTPTPTAPVPSEADEEAAAEAAAAEAVAEAAAEEAAGEGGEDEEDMSDEDILAQLRAAASGGEQEL